MPVEISNRVGTIGDAHSDPDATRINLSNDSFRVLISRCDRTDLCAWRVITMHARDGKKAHLYIGVIPLHFRNKVHPELRPSQFGPFFSGKGDIILLTAGHHTRLTARSLV